MALPNPIPAACSLHRSQRLRTGRGGQEAKLERGRLRSVRCCKVVQMPAVPTAPGTETVCPQPSYTTSVSEAYCNQIPGPAGGAVRRVTITETLLRHSVQAQQWGHSAQGMAQKLGERTKAPAEATGLYRAMLLRSGKWEPRHHRDHPMQTAAPLFLPSLVPRFFPSNHLKASTFLHHSLLCPSFSSLSFFLPSIALFLVWKHTSVHKCKLVLTPHVLPAEVLRGPCRGWCPAVSPRACSRVRR